MYWLYLLYTHMLLYMPVHLVFSFDIPYDGYLMLSNVINNMLTICVYAISSFYCFIIIIVCEM